MSNRAKIIYTHTDEAPLLATYSLLPIIRSFAGAVGVDVDTRDISLAGRILAAFELEPDALAELGDLATTPEANIIKLPNISASVPQLEAAIAELQALGFAIPDYVDAPTTDAEAEAKSRYDKVKGSAVNPVLREGNSDRRAPRPVKNYARSHPHRMGAWSPESGTHVATMGEADFFSNEKSVTMTSDDTLRIELVTDAGTTVLKEAVKVHSGEVVDGTFMSAAALDEFLAQQIDDAAERGVLFSIHLKATMMKVSDPIIFGHAVRAFYGPLFDKYGDQLAELGANPNNGWGDVEAAAAKLPAATKAEFDADLAALYASRPGLAMVNSDKGITNLHVPSDVIIDASMPAMIRESGKMWNAVGATEDCKATIPDSSYAGVYQAVIDDCIANGAYDPTTMGSVSNVGLMAKKAEEYGSHDKTFEIPASGTVRVLDSSGEVLIEHEVAQGDIWRMCNTQEVAIRDWVKLAVTRARATDTPAVFWLDAQRAHDAELITQVQQNLGDHDTTGLTIEIMSPADATRYSIDRIRQGLDTISVTGNVLRDYNTDLFPILEVGTSAKMLSIVPLLNGGGLFETGAGGSAPKHVQQLVEENYLRWDSLGEFMALVPSFEQCATASGNPQVAILAAALDAATERLLVENRSPARKLGQIDNRGSHAYLAQYWAQALADHTEDSALAERFAPLAAALAGQQDTIQAEMIAVQGSPADIGGYYRPDSTKVEAVMRPSPTLNTLIDSFANG